MLGNTKIKSLLETAVKSRASDLHLMVGKPPILRIDGVLQPIKNEKELSEAALEDLIFSLLEPAKKEMFLKKLEADLSYEISDLARFRLNLFFEKGGMALAARIIPYRTPKMKEILMPESVYNLLVMKQGLILVTGPTGCGKSTSLAAMINYINDERAEHIITLEDPIEFIFESNKSIVAQRELGEDMLSFGDGLKHIVRQDPDIIMVGEMRDLETIGAAITLAETGHLILATLHTQNAAQTIDRIIDVFPPYQQEQVRAQLSLSLKAVISQQLLPKKEGGRIAAREILMNNAAVANLIRENKIAQIKSVIQTSAKEGMITIDQDLKRLYKEGVVTKEAAVGHMMSPGTLDEIKVTRIMKEMFSMDDWKSRDI
ncbi:type IV pilus twitching motility protein PilT [Candidatus Falkowbacteria bacterium]|nr:type IV pilus twitching motility protein PilT [Candidatus Falkowbacteria bacterium]